MAVLMHPEQPAMPADVTTFALSDTPEEAARVLYDVTGDRPPGLRRYTGLSPA